MPVLGCIADDFTGATDLAALVSRSGAQVALRIGVPEAAPDPADLAEIEVIALKIRSVPAADAVAAARAALDWLRRAGAVRFYWKYCSTFDSTAAGNIGPVAEALMADLGAARTLYVPSFPENGRRVFMGTLFVGRQPLAESPMRDHPLTPMRDSDLTRLLARQVAGKVGLIDWPVVARGPEFVRHAIAGAGAPHLVADAVQDLDLSALAEAAQDMVLLTGGSALAAHLPAEYRRAGVMGPADPAAAPAIPQGRALVLSGSCSEMTRRQVARYAGIAPALRIDPLEMAARGPGAVIDWLAQQQGPALIYATAEPAEVRAAQEKLGADRAGAVIEEALADIVRAARAAGVQRFVVAGGESSGAVAHALGVTRLRIGPEIAPGVPWCVAGDDLAVALKSGNFGGPDFFAEALRCSASPRIVHAPSAQPSHPQGDDRDGASG